MKVHRQFRDREIPKTDCVRTLPDARAKFKIQSQSQCLKRVTILIRVSEIVVDRRSVARRYLAVNARTIVVWLNQSLVRACPGIGGRISGP